MQFFNLDYIRATKKKNKTIKLLVENSAYGFNTNDKRKTGGKGSFSYGKFTEYYEVPILDFISAIVAIKHCYLTH